MVNKTQICGCNKNDPGTIFSDVAKINVWDPCLTRVPHVGPWFARRSKVGLLFDKGPTRGSMVCEKVQSGSLV